MFCANRSIFETMVLYSSRSSNIIRDAFGIIVCQCSFWVASSLIPTEDPGVVLPNRLIPSNDRDGDIRVCCGGGGISTIGGSERGVNDSSKF